MNTQMMLNKGEVTVINGKVNVFDGIDWIDVKNAPFEVIKFLLDNKLHNNRISEELYNQILDKIEFIEEHLTW